MFCARCRETGSIATYTQWGMYLGTCCTAACKRELPPLQTTCFKARDHLVHSRHFRSLSTMVCRQCQHSLKQIYPRFTVETVKGGRSLRDDMDCKKSTALPSAPDRTVRNTPASVCSSSCFKTVKICTAASRNESLNEA